MISICCACADELSIRRCHPKVGVPFKKERVAYCRVCSGITWAGIQVEELPQGPALEDLFKRFNPKGRT